MRLVIDTNLLINALLSPQSTPGVLLSHWRAKHFVVLTSSQQLDELRRVTRYGRLRARFRPAEAGRLINEIRESADMLRGLPELDVSLDPDDNYLLAMAQLGQADFLVTGDKRDLLSFRLYGRTRIVTAREFLVMHKLLEGPP